MRAHRPLSLLAVLSVCVCLAGCESSGGGGGDVSALRPTAQESLKPSFAEEMRDTLSGQKSMTQELMDSTLLSEQMKQAAGQMANDATGGILESIAQFFK